MEQSEQNWLDALSGQEDCTVLSVLPSCNKKGIYTRFVQGKTDSSSREGRLV